MVGVLFDRLARVRENSTGRGEMSVVTVRSHLWEVYISDEDIYGADVRSLSCTQR